MDDAEHWLETGRLPLSDEAFERIVSATCERPHRKPLPRPAPDKLAKLRRALEEAGAGWRLGIAVRGPGPSRSDEWRRMGSIAGDAERLLEKLDTAALVWLGSLLDEERGRDEYSDEPSGFELVGNDAEGVRRILRLALESARRLHGKRSAEGRGKRGRFAKGTPVKRSRDALGPDIVGWLAMSFERAFGCRAGASRGGPLARLATEFFKVHHEEAKPLARAKTFLLSALRNGPRAESAVVQKARKAGVQTPLVLIPVDNPSESALQHAKPLESIPKSALEHAADALGVERRRRVTAASVIERSRDGTKERRRPVAVVFWALPPGGARKREGARKRKGGGRPAVRLVPPESTLARWLRDGVARHREAQRKLGKEPRRQHNRV